MLVYFPSRKETILYYLVSLILIFQIGFSTVIFNMKEQPLMCEVLNELLEFEKCIKHEVFVRIAEVVTRLQNLVDEREQKLKENNRIIRKMKYDLGELDKELLIKGELIQKNSRQLKEKENIILDQKIALTKKSILLNEKETEINKLKMLLVNANIDIPAPTKSMISN